MRVCVSVCVITMACVTARVFCTSRVSTCCVCLSVQHLTMTRVCVYVCVYCRVRADVVGFTQGSEDVINVWLDGEQYEFR